MMKKKGFTLAEILITLTIIGVIAVLTLPALMTNTQEAQARAGVKKMMNTVTNAAALASAGSLGYDFDGITEESAAGKGTLSSYLNNSKKAPDGSLARLFADTTNIELSQSSVPPTNIVKNFGGVNVAIRFKDGTAIYFDGSKKSEDGIQVLFDYNGSKGPNRVSHCAPSGTSQGWEMDNNGDCSSKTDRHIGDTFMMKLEGNGVTPIGASSVWMYDEKVFKASDVNYGNCSGS